MSQTAFAIIHNDQIDINTVYKTERGAMVNALVTIGRVMVYDDWTDELIKRTFDQRLSNCGYRVAKVKIIEIKEYEKQIEELQEKIRQFEQAIIASRGGPFTAGDFP